MSLPRFPNPTLNAAALASVVRRNQAANVGYTDESKDPLVTNLVPTDTSVAFGTGTNIVSGNRNAIVNGNNNTLSGNNSAVIGSAGLDAAALSTDYRKDETTYMTNLYVSGNCVFLRNLPTSDPGVVDQVWNDAGTLKVSMG